MSYALPGWIHDVLVCSSHKTNQNFFCLSSVEVNVVSESEEEVEVPSSIATNVIGQNTDVPATSSSEMMCERSCEELANLFQELKGLRVVVSNLIDGLQKVVSPVVSLCNLCYPTPKQA